MKTHNDIDIDPSGTSLQGYIQTTYYELLALFGEPMGGDGYKVDAEWNVLFDDGAIATIYNWKNGPNYLGTDGLDVTDIMEWHVGGHSKDVVDRVTQVLKEN